MRTSSLTWCLLALLIVGCSGPIGDTTVPAGEADPFGLIPDSGPHREFISYAVRMIDPDTRLTEESIAFHREVFADGELTAAEYERGVFADAECLTAQGFEVDGPYRGLVLVVGVDSSQILTFAATDAPGIDEAWEECSRQWRYTVERVWNQILDPTEEEREIWLEAAWECARERGIPLSDPPTEDEALAVSGPEQCQPWEALPER